jgi:outer membrane autotransporter protein
MNLIGRTLFGTFLQVSCVSLLLPITPIEAACTLVSGAGNDSSVCDSGVSAGLTDLAGNNVLIFPEGGSGVVSGDVLYGAGADQIIMSSGTLQGAVNQGAGANVFVMNAGTVTGRVVQGAGIDNFFMRGGSVQSLAQGDSRDVFSMSGGTIIGAFEDGDVATMSGGTIGRVDMKLDNNLFELSGGRIVGNLVTGFGRDTIVISGGSIGGNLSVSGGNDTISVSGGRISGEVRASFGDDIFGWSGGGLIDASVLMGDGNDRALIGNLEERSLSSTPSVDGGLGNDRLTFIQTSTAGAGRYPGWETVELIEQSRLKLDGDFFLGDSVSGTGTFVIDSTSVLDVSQGSIRPYTAGQLATLSNGGIIDMATNSSVASDTLTVDGNYIGNGGQLLLQTTLGDDRSASDRLVVSQGTISGSTQLGVRNLNGLGGLTQVNGIVVVQAINGATSTNDAFVLGNRVVAGAYRYQLFKGGLTAGTENSWFLRSSVAAIRPPASAPPMPPSAPPVVGPVVNPVPDPVTPPAGIPPVVTEPTRPIPVDADEPPVEPPTAIPAALPVAPATPPIAPSATPAAVSPMPAPSALPIPAVSSGAEPIPLYRLEVPIYSVFIPAAQIMAREAVGTFHDRQGDQSLLSETGTAPAGWARLYGSDVRQEWTGTASPRFDGSTKGYQVGHDLYAAPTDSGQVQHAGVFVGQSRLQGSVKGFAEGFKDTKAGRMKINGDHLGAYWTLADPGGAYLDAVVMAARLDGSSRSNQGVRLDTDGHALSLSLETGYPMAISEHWVIEPQAQVIHQRIDLDRHNDGISDVAFDSQPYWTTRLGARLKGRYVVDNLPIEPYVRANVWHVLDGKDTVTYNGIDRIKTRHRSSSSELGVGVVVGVAPGVSVYMAVDYAAQLDSNDFAGASGSMGVRVSW